MYPTMTHPMPPLQPLQHLYAPAFQSTFSSIKFTKELKDVNESTLTHTSSLSDTSNQELPQNPSQDSSKSTLCQNQEQLYSRREINGHLHQQI